MTTGDSAPVPDYANLLRLDGRGYVVVGAGQGMGRQTAHALAQQGARVVCVDIDEQRAEEVAAEIGGVACVGDACDGEQAARIVATAEREVGPLFGIADVGSPAPMTGTGPDGGVIATSYAPAAPSRLQKIVGPDGRAVWVVR